MNEQKVAAVAEVLTRTASTNGPDDTDHVARQIVDALDNLEAAQKPADDETAASDETADETTASTQTE